MQQPLVDADDVAVLAGERASVLNGEGEHLVEGGDPVHEPGGGRLGPRPAPGRVDGLGEGTLGQPGGQQGVDAGVDGQAEVRFGHAPVAAVLAHHGVVADRAQHGAGSERVAVHGGHGRAREAQDAGQGSEQPGEEVTRAVGVRCDVVEIEAVAEELAGAGDDQGDRSGVGLDLVEAGRQLSCGGGVPAVLAVVHGEHNDVVVPFEFDHGGDRRRRRRRTRGAGGGRPVDTRMARLACRRG